MPAVARPGQTLGRDRPPLGPSAGLQQMKQPEPHGLLHRRIAIHLDVGADQNSSR